MENSRKGFLWLYKYKQNSLCIPHVLHLKQKISELTDKSLDFRGITHKDQYLDSVKLGKIKDDFKIYGLRPGGNVPQ